MYVHSAISNETRNYGDNVTLTTTVVVLLLLLLIAAAAASAELQ